MRHDAGYGSAFKSDIQVHCLLCVFPNHRMISNPASFLIPAFLLVEDQCQGGEMVNILSSGKDVISEIFPFVSATLAVYPYDLDTALL